MLTLIAKDDLTEEEFLKCQQIIYNLIAFEARHEPLTLPLPQQRYVSSSIFTRLSLVFMANFLRFHRLKGTKKDDQYKLLWAELVHLIQNGPQSPNHKKLLTFIKNENVTDENKDSKRLSTQVTNSPMSPPGPSEAMAANKKKTQHLLNSSGNR